MGTRELTDLSPLLKYGDRYLADSSKELSPWLLEAQTLRNLCVQDAKMEGVINDGEEYSNDTVPGIVLRIEDDMLFATVIRNGIINKVLVCAEKDCKGYPQRCLPRCSNHESIRKLRADLSFRAQETANVKKSFKMILNRRQALLSLNLGSPSVEIKKRKKK